MNKQELQELIDKIRKDAIIRQDPKCWGCGGIAIRDGRYGPLYCTECKVSSSKMNMPT